MSKLSIIAKLTCDPDKVDDFEAALASMVEAADEESGLEIYSVHKDDNEAGTYWFFELYADADALGVHGKGDGMKAAMGAIGGLLNAPPDVKVLNPTVAKGLAL